MGWGEGRTRTYILSEHRPPRVIHTPNNQHSHVEHSAHQRYRLLAHPHLHGSPAHLIDQVEAAATRICCSL